MITSEQTNEKHLAASRMQAFGLSIVSLRSHTCAAQVSRAHSNAVHAESHDSTPARTKMLTSVLTLHTRKVCRPFASLLMDPSTDSGWTCVFSSALLSW